MEEQDLILNASPGTLLMYSNGDVCDLREKMLVELIAVNRSRRGYVSVMIR